MAAKTRQKLVARLENERDPEVLGQYIHDRAWQVRFAAIQSLGKSGSPAAEGYLIEVLQSNPDPQDLPFANSALGKVGSKSAIPVLSSLIHHRVEDVKSSAISALGALGDASLTPLYLDALSDRSWLAKWSAMGAIAGQADARAVGPVAERLRAILGRDRKTNVGGTTEVMYALEYLDRWRAKNDIAAQAIEWVRSTALHRLEDGELAWFEERFGKTSSRRDA